MRLQDGKTLTTDGPYVETKEALGGLTTTEIARAFLVGEATMAQRLVRAELEPTVRG